MPAKKRKRTGRGDATQHQQKDKTPVQDLPLEVLALIFQEAVADGGVLVALTISQSCKAWRDIASNMQELWRDARVGDLKASAPKKRDAHVKELIEICARRSNDTIRHADLKGFTKVKIFTQCLDLLLPSADTIVDLDVDQNDLCRCQWCKSDDSSWMPSFNKLTAKSKKAKDDMHAAGTSLLTLVSRARHLDRLVLHFRILAVSEFDLECEARPRDVSITIPCIACTSENAPKPTHGGCDSDASCDSGCGCGQNEDVSEELQPLALFLEELSSNVQALVVQDSVTELRWARWPDFRQSHHLLRFCRIPSTRLFLLVEQQLSDFPCLEALIVDDDGQLFGEDLLQDLTDQAQGGTMWIQAPILQRFYGTPTLARKIQAASITSITTCFLQVTQPEAVENLSQLFMHWPDLQSLAVEIQESFGSRGFALFAIDDIINILTPSSCAMVLCPKLRHLGLLAARIAAKSSFADVSEPRWASMPWSEAESEWWYADDYRRIAARNTAWPSIGRALAQLERERRTLSQGTVFSGTPPAEVDDNGNVSQAGSSSTKTTRGSCVALEVIKLGGFNFDFAAW